MEEAIKIVEAKLASITQENNYFAMGARSALQEILAQLQAAQQSVRRTLHPSFSDAQIEEMDEIAESLGGE